LRLLLNNDPERAVGLLRELRSKSSQYGALQQLKSKDVEPDRISQYSNELVNIISGDNALTKLLAKDLLKNWAQDHPQAVGAGISDDLQVLLRWLDEADQGVRAPLSHVLGATGRLEPLEALKDRYETEVPSVQRSIDQGLEAAITSILTELKSGEVSDDSEAAESMLFLSRHYPALAVRHEQDLFDLLEGPNGELVSEVFVQILHSGAQDDLSVSVLVEAVEIDEEATEGRILAAVNAFKTLLQTKAESDILETVTSQYLDWLKKDDMSTRRTGLRFIEAAAEHKPELISQSLDNVAVLAVEGSLTDYAREVIIQYALSKSTNSTEYIQSLLTSTGGEPAFLWLSEILEVLNYKDEREWEEIQINTLGRSILTGLHQATIDGSTVPIFWPSYDPKTTVTCAVSVLFEGVSESRDTVFYTKGTTTQWGQKEEVRDEYAKYGINVPKTLREEPNEKIQPLDKILPHSYIYQGERRVKGNSPGQSTLIIVSYTDELDSVVDDIPILFNFHSRVTEQEESLVNNTAEESNQLVCPMYSLYSKHDYGGNRVPQYCPPDVIGAGTLPDKRAVRDVLDESPKESSREEAFPLSSNGDLVSLGSVQEVQIKPVDADLIKEYLNEGYDAAMDLVEFGSEHAGWRSFSYLQRFERLPVLADQYDQWVLDKRRRGKRGQRSWTMEEFVNEFSDFKSGVDMLARAGTSDVHEQLENLVLALEKRNPMYEAVCNHISNAVDDGKSIAIYTPTPSWRRVLKETLRSDRIISEVAFRKNQIQLVDRDSVRDIQSCDELVIIGPQRSQHIGFLLHPLPDKVTILTYDGRWQGMISRHLRRFVDKINEGFQYIESKPIPYPDVDVLGGDPQTESDSFETSDSEPEQPRASQEKFAATLDGMRLDTEYAYDRDRYDDYEQQSFRIETSNGTLDRDSGSTLLVEERSVNDSGVDRIYKWVSPAELAIGSTVLVIDQELWNQLWNEWLDEQYADFEGGNVTDQLKIWYTTVCDIVQDVKTNSGTDIMGSEDAIKYIVSELKKEGIERGENRIRHWFESGLAADDAFDLARDPSLTMGPGNLQDIQLIGIVFNRSELTGEKGALVDRALGKIRGAHVHQGRKIRHSIAQELTDGGAKAEQLLSSSTRHEIKKVKDITDLES